jgi:tRNA threonylcarbamoyladenosine biosynthesis protein TsaE
MIYSLETLDAVVELLHDKMGTCKVFTFTGPLGAGKTTLIKKLLKRCGVHEVVTSPTFTYLQQYKNDRGQLFNHFDLYRLSSLNEFQEMGFDEYLYQPDSWTLIEWPRVVLPLLTHNVYHLELDYVSEHERSLEVTTPSASV